MAKRCFATWVLLVPTGALVSGLWKWYCIIVWGREVYKNTQIESFLPGDYKEAQNYTEFFDEKYSKGYHDHLTTHFSWESHVVDLLENFAGEEKVAPVKDVIVLGCSHGLGATWLQERGFRAWGVDVAEKAIQLAVASRGRTCGEGTEPCFVRASLTHLPYETGQFDAGISSDVLEHIQPGDVTRVVEEMTRVVRRLLVLQIAGWADDCETCQDEVWWADRFVEAGWTKQVARRREAPWPEGFWAVLVLTRSDT